MPSQCRAYGLQMPTVTLRADLVADRLDLVNLSIAGVDIVAQNISGDDKYFGVWLDDSYIGLLKRTGDGPWVVVTRMNGKSKSASGINGDVYASLMLAARSFPELASRLGSRK